MYSSNRGGGEGEFSDERASLAQEFVQRRSESERIWVELQGGNAPKSSNSNSSSSSNSGDVAAASSNTALVSSGHESMHRKVIAIPLDRRPIMPGIIMPVRTFDMTLVAELEDMKKRGQAYVAFLKKERVKESQKEDNSDSSNNNNKGAIAGAVKEGVSGLSVSDLEHDPASEWHDIGTFAQVHNIVRSQDTDPDLKDGNGATLLLLGRHRRIKKLSTDRKSPVTIVNCEHLKDEKHDPDCDVLKATANEVVATIKDLLRTNPLHKETLQYFAQNFNDFQDPARLADLAASMTSADDDNLQAILETLSVPDRLDASLVLLKKEIEIGKNSSRYREEGGGKNLSGSKEVLLERTIKID